LVLCLGEEPYIAEDLFGRHGDYRVGDLRGKLDARYCCNFQMASRFANGLRRLATGKYRWKPCLDLFGLATPMGGPAGRPLRPEADHHLGDLALRSKETCCAAALGLYRQFSRSAEQTRHCAAIVGAEEESIVTGPDAIRTLEATLAVKRAGETGEAVAFDSENGFRRSYRAVRSPRPRLG
jgi:hypothetical protein